jgi:hypothetical protein
MEWEETGKLCVGVRGKELRWKKGKGERSFGKTKEQVAG